jgi:capsular exopolysaccharide synthesis family protein
MGGDAGLSHRVNLKQTLKKVLKKGWIILVLIVAFAAGARFFSQNYIEKVYKAEATLFIGKEQGMQTNITLSELEASNQLIVDYKEIASSRLVIEPVMEELGIDMALKDFRKALSLEILDNSRLFSLGFSSEDPKLAARVADAMAYQLTEAVADIVNVENIRIVDLALVPTEPVYPNVNIITLLAAVVGLLGGLLFVYFNDLFNDTFSSQEGVESELQMDVIAIIPKYKDKRKTYNKGLVTLNEPNSYLSESFKMLRTNINYMNKDAGNKVVMLTSSVAAEGKTTTSCNLAIAMAQEHKKVLLIDGDLRKPNLFKTFRINMMPGLTDIIYGKYALEEAVQRVIDLPGLDVLASGRHTSMTTELLGSVSFRRILDEARERYDIIIIDAPPVLNVSDTIIISKLVDKVLFVVAMEKTNRGLVREAKKGLDKVSVKTMGMILTNMTINPRSYYYGSGERGRRSRGRH